jgi:hypothetical protein
MDEAILLQDLESLAGNLDIEIRYDRLDRDGGLCRYGGRNRLILNRSLSIPERVQLIARALARFPLDDIYIRPHVRDLLEQDLPDLP